MSGSRSKSKVGFQERLGSDLFGGNGDCTTDWLDSLGVNWAYSADNDNYVKSAGVDPSLATKENVVSAGKLYKIVWTLVRTAGNVKVKVGGTEGLSHNESGTHTDYVTSGATNAHISFRGSGAGAGTIDDMTAYEVDLF